jgi:hypothetical protein
MADPNIRPNPAISIGSEKAHTLEEHRVLGSALYFGLRFSKDDSLARWSIAVREKR